MEPFILFIGALAIFYYFKKKRTNRHSAPEIKVTISTENDDDDYQQDYGYDYDPPKITQYWDNTEWILLKARLRLNYTSARNETTERTINISGYDVSAYLRGLCELRNEPRIFRIDRIKKAIDVDTGEIIASVPDYLLNKYHQSPAYIISKTFDKYLDIIKVLFFMGKADGQLRAAERGIICEAIRDLAKNKTLENDDINEFVNQLDIPSMHGFKLAFGRVCKSHPERTAEVYALTQKIVNTQKTVHANESEALEYMTKKIKKDGLAN